MIKKFVACIIFLAFFTLIGCGQPLKAGDSFEGFSIVWKDYEKAVYDFYVGDEKRMPVYYTIQKGIKGEREVYNVDFALELEEGFNGTGAVVDASSLKPITSYNRQIPPRFSSNEKRESLGTYEDNKLNLTVVKGEKEQKLSVRIPENTIDNESSLMMIRNFPLEDGYGADINIAVVATAVVAPYTLKVECVEDVEVPYGTFTCYKVVLKYNGRGSAPDIYAWYTADEDKIMVKYVQQNMRFELNDYQVESQR